MYFRLSLRRQKFNPNLHIIYRLYTHSNVFDFTGPFCLCLIVSGASQAPLWPACTKMISKWYPENILGTTIGLVNFYLGCCVFRPVNGCSACRLLVKIDFLMLKQLFPSLTEQNKQKIKGKPFKIMQNTQ